VSGRPRGHHLQERIVHQRGDPDYLPGIRQRLYTAVLSDVLDELGHREQAMAPAIRPLV
jgi:hypothetical protein